MWRELRRKETQRSSATSERVDLGYLDDHNAQPVRVSYLHLPQPPRLVSRELDNIHSGLFQLVSYCVDVSHLQPQTYTLAGPSARGARQLKEASSEEENHPPRGSAAPLAVEVQTEALGVEPKRALEVGGTHQHPTRENLHVITLPSRNEWATTFVDLHQADVPIKVVKVSTAPTAGTAQSMKDLQTEEILDGRYA